MTPDGSSREACADAMWNDDRATQRLGMSLEHVAPGQATLCMTVHRPA